MSSSRRFNFFFRKRNSTKSTSSKNFNPKNVEPLYLSEKYSDITLIVGGQRLNAHKVILATNCEYFRALIYGVMKESSQDEIELKDIDLKAFKVILEYLYTKRMNFEDKNEEEILGVLKVVDQLGFTDIDKEITDYLSQVLSDKNASLIYETAELYGLITLAEVSCQFIYEHATDIIQHESFLKLSCASLKKLIAEDIFFAPEIDIFKVVTEWLKLNPEVDASEIIDKIRFSLMSVDDLEQVVKPTGLVSEELIDEIITAKNDLLEPKDARRRFALLDQNVFDAKLGAEVLQGRDPKYLLHGDEDSRIMERTTWHRVTGEDSDGIILKLGKLYRLNRFKMLLPHNNTAYYFYYIESSTDQKKWNKVIDYRKYSCQGWQHLYFEPRAIRYIKIVGVSTCSKKIFEILHFECEFSSHTENLYNGIIVPDHNIGKLVVSRIFEASKLRVNFSRRAKSDPLYHYCHIGVAVVRLDQPHMIDWIRFYVDDRLLWWRSFYMQASNDGKKYERVISVQEICNPVVMVSLENARPLTHIRVISTMTAAMPYSENISFECSAQSDVSDMCCHRTGGLKKFFGCR